MQWNGRSGRVRDSLTHAKMSGWKLIMKSVHLHFMYNHLINLCFPHQIISNSNAECLLLFSVFSTVSNTRKYSINIRWILTVMSWFSFKSHFVQYLDWWLRYSSHAKRKCSSLCTGYLTHWTFTLMRQINYIERFQIMNHSQ